MLRNGSVARVRFNRHDRADPSNSSRQSSSTAIHLSTRYYNPRRNIVQGVHRHPHILLPHHRRRRRARNRRRHAGPDGHRRRRILRDDRPRPTAESSLLPRLGERQAGVGGSTAHDRKYEVRLVGPAEVTHELVIGLVLDQSQSAILVVRFPLEMLVLALPADFPCVTSSRLESDFDVQLPGRAELSISLRFSPVWRRLASLRSRIRELAVERAVLASPVARCCCCGCSSP